MAQGVRKYLLGVLLNVYNLWFSKELAMSSEVRGRFTTTSYFLRQFCGI